MTDETKPKAKRGFGAMDPELAREISRRGGAAVPADKRSFAANPDLAARAGRVGGSKSRGGGPKKAEPETGN